MTYTITTHWKPSKHTDLDEPITETAPDWPTARTMALKLTTLRATAAVIVRDPDGELIANWDQYSNLWREPRPKPLFIDTLVDVARARLLAADYQANPTPARAHNAAQVLQHVLNALDATVARTFAITDENSRLVAASPLGKAAPRTRPGLPSITADDERQHPAWPHIDDEAEAAPDCVQQRRQYQRTRCADETCRRCWLGGPHNWPSRQPPKLCPGFPVAEPHFARLACFLPEGHAGDHDNQPATGPAFGHPIPANQLPRIPVPICFADGPQLGANTLTCHLARGHEGDHSTNAHPNPRTWPPLATGGIVDPTTIARIGE